MNPVLSHARGAPSHVPSSVFYCLANSSTRPRCITTEISDRVEKVHFLSVEKTHVTNVIDVKLEGSFGAKLSRKKGRKKRESREWKKAVQASKYRCFFQFAGRCLRGMCLLVATKRTNILGWGDACARSLWEKFEKKAVAYESGRFHR